MFGHHSLLKIHLATMEPETFTHAWHIENVSNATAPNQSPIIQPSMTGKVTDALNLAIVFHQHQPYYKK